MKLSVRGMWSRMESGSSRRVLERRKEHIHLREVLPDRRELASARVLQHAEDSFGEASALDLLRPVITEEVPALRFGVRL